MTGLGAQKVEKHWAGQSVYKKRVFEIIRIWIQNYSESNSKLFGIVFEMRIIDIF